MFETTELVTHAIALLCLNLKAQIFLIKGLIVNPLLPQTI